jgi:hypothetical protein
MFDDLEGLNFEKLRRKRAFKSGSDIIIDKEFNTGNQLKDFRDETDVLPVTLTES